MISNEEKIRDGNIAIGEEFDISSDLENSLMRQESQEPLEDFEKQIPLPFFDVQGGNDTLITDPDNNFLLAVANQIFASKDIISQSQFPMKNQETFVTRSSFKGRVVNNQAELGDFDQFLQKSNTLINHSLCPNKPNIQKYVVYLLKNTHDLLVRVTNLRQELLETRSQQIIQIREFKEWIKTESFQTINETMKAVIQSLQNRRKIISSSSKTDHQAKSQNTSVLIAKQRELNNENCKINEEINKIDIKNEQMQDEIRLMSHNTRKLLETCTQPGQISQQVKIELVKSRRDLRYLQLSIKAHQLKHRNEIRSLIDMIDKQILQMKILSKKFSSSLVITKKSRELSITNSNYTDYLARVRAAIDDSESKFQSYYYQQEQRILLRIKNRKNEAKACRDYLSRLKNEQETLVNSLTAEGVHLEETIDQSEPNHVRSSTTIKQWQELLDEEIKFQTEMKSKVNDELDIYKKQISRKSQLLAALNVILLMLIVIFAVPLVQNRRMRDKINTVL